MQEIRLSEQAVAVLSMHYGLKAKKVRALPSPMFRLMLQHIAEGRPCDHPGGTLGSPG